MRTDALHHAPHDRRSQRREGKESRDRESQGGRAETEFPPNLHREPAGQEGREHRGGRDRHREQDGAAVQDFVF